MSAMDDLPALESAPLLFDLTHLSEAAAAVRPGRGRGRGGAATAGRGQKRGRGKQADISSEDSDDSDEDSEDDDDDDGEDAQAAAAVPPRSSDSASAIAASANADDDDSEDEFKGTRRRKTVAKKEADVDGVARARWPIVQTIHATAWLGREVDVITIARICNNAVYLPPSGVRFTIRSPHGVAMVYKSGKYVVMGGKSTIDMVTIARKVARKVQKIGNHPDFKEYKGVGFHNFSINNISANAAFGYRINLRALSEDPAFGDYTEYEPEQWKGLHYRLPVDPTKTLADLLPSYAHLLASRRSQGQEQFSNDEFLGTGKHALVSKGALNYYATTGLTGSRATKVATDPAAKPKGPTKVPASLNGRVLTATIYSNGRLTLTGVRREQDIHDAYLRLFVICQAFATSLPPDAPPAQPPYPRAFLPGQRRKIKREQQESSQPLDFAAASAAAASMRDIKPNFMPTSSSTSSAMFVLPAGGRGAQPQPNRPLPPAAVKSEVKLEHPPVKREEQKDARMADVGNDLGSAIVLEGLPDVADNASHEDVEWE